jgi:hypothetical protein
MQEAEFQFALLTANSTSPRCTDTPFCSAFSNKLTHDHRIFVALSPKRYQCLVQRFMVLQLEEAGAAAPQGGALGEAAWAATLSAVEARSWRPSLPGVRQGLRGGLMCLQVEWLCDCVPYIHMCLQGFCASCHVIAPLNMLASPQAFLQAATRWLGPTCPRRAGACRSGVLPELSFLALCKQVPRHTGVRWPPDGLLLHILWRHQNPWAGGGPLVRCCHRALIGCAAVGPVAALYCDIKPALPCARHRGCLAMRAYACKPIPQVAVCCR